MLLLLFIIPGTCIIIKSIRAHDGVYVNFFFIMPLCRKNKKHHENIMNVLSDRVLRIRAEHNFCFIYVCMYEAGQYAYSEPLSVLLANQAYSQLCTWYLPGTTKDTFSTATFAAG